MTAGWYHALPSSRNPGRALTLQKKLGEADVELQGLKEEGD
jgi:hypothetical protein